MKTIRAILLLILASGALSAVAAPFEGKIVTVTTEGKKSFTTTYYCKGDKMRVETTEGDEGGVVIFDMAAKQMIMIMPSEKMYMTMNIGQHMNSNKPSDPPVKTGRTETILGYDCDEYTVTEGKRTTTFWGAHGLGVFHAMMRGGPGGPPSGPSAFESAAESEGVFPLRTIETVARGREVSRTEATSVEPGSQPDSLFAPPKGYQSFSMPGMMGR